MGRFQAHADGDQIKLFIKELKKFQMDVERLSFHLNSRLKSLESYWRDDAYRQFRDEFTPAVRELDKRNKEFVELKVEELNRYVKDLEEYLAKRTRR